MKTLRVLGAACAALLVTGCSAPATTAPAASPDISSPATTTLAPASVPAGGQEIDKATILQKIAQAQAGVKTSTTSIDVNATSAGTATQIKMVSVVDQTTAGRMLAKTTMSASGADMTMILDGDTYYTQMSGTWFKMSKADLEKTGASVPDVTDQSGVLNDMSDKIQKVEFIGDDTVEGVATKHYRMTLDGSAISELQTGATAAPATTLPYDLWVDSSGLMRKFAMALKQDSGDFSMTGVVTKINEPVTIDIPTNAQPFPGQ